MRLNLLITMFLTASAGSGIHLLAQEQPDPNAEVDRKILADVQGHNEMANLAYLCDVIGPRLTGSENLTKASRWAAQKMREYGLENVHLEPWKISHSWTRGVAEGRIVSPANHRITIASYCWTAGTHGAIQGPVVYVNPKKPEDLAAYKGKLKGAIVILFGLHDWEPPPNPMLTPLWETSTPMNKSKPPMDFSLFSDIYRFLGEEGAAAVLVPSDKRNGLLNMWNLGYLGTTSESPKHESYGIAPTATAYVVWEDYNLIWRLLQRGRVELQLNIQNSYSDKPVEVYNVVGEIRGVEKPDEIVVLGAHLDSWDLGTGATDDGSGCVAVLEAVRALRSLGLKPKRTIRVVLFSGEEQGLVGSRAYIEAHRAESLKLSAVLIHDSGTGKVLSIGMEGNYAAREVMDKVLAPAPELGLLESSLRSIGFDDDHGAFDYAGVPAFWTIQDPLDYGQTHHSQIDTFDHVEKNGLIQGAQVLAVWANNVAALPGMMPRKIAPKKIDSTVSR